ncbi:nucleotidyltransferase family protein [Microbulbifer yueqingensis]|uniref:Molybdenum cofactor cytidylyltransferase n=1 Tax=Microbulbifer yueqingensis TaxID=658219 RepID=A0A1G8VAL6_9GAMM|nr:nucleotidyltransferase family protein [Microbulbifer yueqingensis]SDJ63156.1 molybdenum cofactor cytidylyltransferase [Microbulbifer yueqingensis]
MKRVQPIILAAGAANRFGACKLLLEWRGKTLLQHCVNHLESLGLPSPIVVSGAWHRELEQAHPQLDMREHRDWRAGMGSSLAFGIRHVPPECSAALVLLADQVAVGAGDIAALLAAWERKRGVVCARYCQRRGVPAIFPAKTFARLARLEGDRGARDLLRRDESDITSLPLPAAAVDIDTREDWLEFRQSRTRQG